MYEELIQSLRERAEFLTVSDVQKAPPGLTIKNLFAETMSEAADAIEAIRDRQRWIPVTERLPENTFPVNVVWVNHAPASYYAICKDKPFVATGIYHRDTWYWWSATTEDYLNEYGRCEWDQVDGAIEITHWMPLPEPPKGEDDDNKNL